MADTDTAPETETETETRATVRRRPRRVPDDEPIRELLRLRPARFVARLASLQRRYCDERRALLEAELSLLTPGSGVGTGPAPRRRSRTPVTSNGESGTAGDAEKARRKAHGRYLGCMATLKRKGHVEEMAVAKRLSNTQGIEKAIEYLQRVVDKVRDEPNIARPAKAE